MNGHYAGVHKRGDRYMCGCGTKVTHSQVKPKNKAHGAVLVKDLDGNLLYVVCTYCVSKKKPKDKRVMSANRHGEKVACATCGKVFEKVTHTHRYCSADCRVTRQFNMEKTFLKEPAIVYSLK